MKIDTLGSLPVTVIICIAAISLFECTGAANQDRIKFTQYFNRGEALYQTHCSNCHQKDGSGLGQLYPPVRNTDFMQDRTAVICLIKHGITGEITVDGKAYNQEMPGVPSLTNLEIAEITTYIYNAWSDEKNLIDVREVSGVMETCKP